MAPVFSMCSLRSFSWKLKIKFISDVDFPSWHSKVVKLNFWQYQSDRNNDKCTCCLEILSKIAAIIFICLEIHIWSLKFHVVAQKILFIPEVFKYQPHKNNSKFTYFLENHRNTWKISKSLLLYETQIIFLSNIAFPSLPCNSVNSNFL